MWTKTKANSINTTCSTAIFLKSAFFITAPTPLLNAEMP